MQNKKASCILTKKSLWHIISASTLKIRIFNFMQKVITIFYTKPSKLRVLSEKPIHNI